MSCSRDSFQISTTEFDVSFREVSMEWDTQVSKKLDGSSWWVRGKFDISYQIVRFESVVESCSCQSLFVFRFWKFRT